MRMKLVLVLFGSLLGCGTDEVGDGAELPVADVEDRHVVQSGYDPNACPDLNKSWYQEFFSDASMTTRVAWRRCVCGYWSYYNLWGATAYYTYTENPNACSREATGPSSM